MEDFDHFLEIKTKRQEEIVHNGLKEIREQGAKFTSRFADALEMVDLSAFRKVILMDRFLSVLARLERRARRYRRYNSVGSMVVSLGSLLTPAFLSIKAESDETKNIIFYVTWSTALATALASSLMQLFQITKRFILFQKTLERLQAEGFLYFELAGSYRTDESEGHSRMFTVFCANVEAIHAIEVASEFKNGAQNEDRPGSEDDTKINVLLSKVRDHTQRVNLELKALDQKERHVT